MQKIKSLLFGAILITRSFQTATPSPFESRTTQRLVIGSSKPDYANMTVKELRKIMTAHKIKGRSKITRKADIVKILSK